MTPSAGKRYNRQELKDLTTKGLCMPRLYSFNEMKKLVSQAKEEGFKQGYIEGRKQPKPSKEFVETWDKTHQSDWQDIAIVDEETGTITFSYNEFIDWYKAQHLGQVVNCPVHGKNITKRCPDCRPYQFVLHLCQAITLGRFIKNGVNYCGICGKALSKAQSLIGTTEPTDDISDEEWEGKIKKA